MRLLLDTHALLWWLGNDASLGASARALITDPSNESFVSIALLWEIVTKVRIGKLVANFNDILAGVQRNHFILLPIMPADLSTLLTLPLHHREPFDRMLLAHAKTNGMSLLSADRQLIRYDVVVIPC